MSDPIRFSATLAGAHTAARWLSVDREGAAKLALEIPASDLAPVLRLAALGDKLLRVTVEVEE